MEYSEGNIREIGFSEICSLFPERRKDSHKGDFGRLLCITGSRRMPGASLMSAYSALRSGAGLVTIASAEENIPALSARCFEAMFLPLKTDDNGFITWHGNEDILCDMISKSDAVLIGCGIGLTEETVFLTENVINLTKCPLIIDADGLNAAAGSIDIIADREEPVILTPHPGEMARLSKVSVQEVQRSRVYTINNMMKQLPGAVIVLKGSGTLVGYKNELCINPTGNPGMSRGGSGDVLAGMIAAFAAQKITPQDAAKAGVYLHGMAGDIAAEKFSHTAMLPRDIIECIPEVFMKVERNR
ncbi:MAG: NAD(P)H-hydrate dehydratase [Ruminococcus sp.]